MVDGGAGTLVCRGQLGRAQGWECKAPHWGLLNPPRWQKGFAWAAGMQLGAGPCPTPQELPVC